MGHVSARVRAISPSPTTAIDGRTKQMIAEGHDVVNFSVGEPDFDTPGFAKSAAVEAIAAGFTKYTHNAGMLELRQAICEKLRVDNGLEYQPDEIVVSNGAKQSLFNAYQAILDAGDEVILQAPYWVSYPEIIKLAGGVPVVVDTAADDFLLTAERIRRHLTPRTRAINLNSPSNPTGAVLPPAELERIAALAVECNLYVVSDEIYEKLLYDGAEHVSIASLGPEIKRLTITINGMSKAHAMTGWRIGYTASERYLASAMSALQSHSTSAPSSISQKASVAALRGPAGAVAEMVAEFRRRRDYIVGRLRQIPGFEVRTPQGAFYVFPKVSGLYGRRIGDALVRSSDDLAAALLESARVAVVPGTGFGAPDYVRISYATSMENIVKGLDRIAAALAG